MDLIKICGDLFGEAYAIRPDGPKCIVINCTLKWDSFEKLMDNVPAQLQNADLHCGLKLCNIPGTVVIIYPLPIEIGNVQQNYGYFVLNIQGIKESTLKRNWRKLYITWAQQYQTNIHFNLNLLMEQQRANARLAREAEVEAGRLADVPPI